MNEDLFKKWTDWILGGSVKKPGSFIDCLGLRDHNGWSLIHMAVKSGDMKKLRTLLSKGVPPNSGASDVSPLYMAVLGGRTDVTSLLLSFNAQAASKAEEEKILSLARIEMPENCNLLETYFEKGVLSEEIQGNRQSRMKKRL